MFWNDYRIFLFLFLYAKNVSSCGDVIWLDEGFGHIQSENFFLGQSHPKNHSCRWMINSTNPSNWIITLRILDLQLDSNSWANELVIQSDWKTLFLNDFNQRTFRFFSTSHLKFDFPIKPPDSSSPSLGIQRFYLEIYRVTEQSDGFHCQNSALTIPQQWQCNCQYECGPFDFSDEDGCPLCDMIPLVDSLLCHSNETWCLPNGSQPSGVCVSPTWSLSCAYQTQCETTVVYSQNQGEILVRNSLLSHRRSLCFVVISKEKSPIQLIINRHDFLNQHSHWTYSIYDGDRKGNQLLAKSNPFVRKKIIRTQGNHLATIVIEKSPKEILNNSVDLNELFFNITWSTNFCQEDQFPCGGHFERKCFTKQQRCDGIWDCISGDDELGCLPSSCPTTFACHNQLRSPSDYPRCYNWLERCNGNAICPNHADEQNCSTWWCNSNNGTFLCRNGLCIYESWRCDGTNDCRDYSDEVHCPSRASRRIITVIILCVTGSTTFFLLAVGCMCKLIHLRSAEQRLSTRLVNTEEDTDETQRVAPPSYSQTMGYSNEADDRLAILTDHLRLAGLANFIPTRSRERLRRRLFDEDPHETPNESQSNPFDRFRSLFYRNLSINNNRPTVDEIDISEHPISSNQSATLESRELPPAYSTTTTRINHTEQTNNDDDDDDDDDDDKILVP